MAMSKTFDDNKEGVTGTPGFVMDGKQLNGGTPLLTVADFDKVVDAALKG
jgi:protein-disulfide isomerase